MGFQAFFFFFFSSEPHILILFRLKKKKKKGSGLQVQCFQVITALWVNDRVVLLASHETVGIALGISYLLLEE